jgi:hypothetical protein
LSMHNGVTRVSDGHLNCWCCMVLHTAAASQADDTGLTPLAVTPQPQRVVMRGRTATVQGWPVGSDGTAPNAASLLANITLSRVVTIASLPSSGPFIAMGLLNASSADTPFGRIAAAHGVTPSAATVVGPEGYVLNVTSTCVILAAVDSAGLFYGVQTLRQIISTDATRSTPTTSIADWPSLPVRGAFMFGAPDFVAGASPDADPGVQWLTALADAMAGLKLNTGIVTSGFWEWIAADGTPQGDLAPRE